MILAIKVILAILIEYIVIMLCRSKVTFYRCRPISLQQLVYSIQNIRNEMVFSNEVIPTIIHKMSKAKLNPTQQLWIDISNDLQKGKDIEASFNNQLKNNQRNLYLSDDDINSLQLLGSQLGQSDLENQLRILKLTQNRMIENERKSLSEKKQQAKLWNSLGILGGLTLVILLW